MKIILTKNIPNLGSRGDVKEVATSFARNVLLRNKQAIVATAENLSKLKAVAGKKAKEQTQALAELAKLNNQLSSLSLKLKEKANDQGRLFAGIDSKKINQILKNEKNIKLKPAQIKLVEPIKELGAYEIDYELSPELKGSFKLIIKA